jgi:hypothetical protein
MQEKQRIAIDALIKSTRFGSLREFQKDFLRGGPYDQWIFIAKALHEHRKPIPRLSELRFLDLGGGSDSFRTGEPPYLSRYLAALGAHHVVNVDPHPVTPGYNDQFTHLQMRLTTHESFSLPNELTQRGLLQEGYHMIHSTMLVDDNPAPMLGFSANQLRERIMDWAQEILMPNGYLFFANAKVGYQLENGELKLFRNHNDTLGRFQD